MSEPPPYDFEDFAQASWPVMPGSPVYLFQAGPHYGKPGKLVRCWPPEPIPPGEDGDERRFHYWRGRVRLDDGTEVDAWELEICVLRPLVERPTEPQWTEFVARLDAPPEENPRLRALFARKPAWEP